MTTEQSKECFEQHKVLKISFESSFKELKKDFDNLKKEIKTIIRNCITMHCFFFGGPNQEAEHISFVDKVNIMYENQKNSRTLLLTFLSVFGVLFISSLIGVGVQIHTINRTSEDLVAVVKNLKEIQEQQNNMQVEIAKFKIKIGEK